MATFVSNKSESALESLFFNYTLYGVACSYLSVKDIVSLEGVNTVFLSKLRSSDICWQETAEALFRDKIFIPSVVKRFIASKNGISQRHDLHSMSIRELKSLARRYALNISTCFEKTDLVNAVNKRELKKRDQHESLARFGVRIAFLDKNRNCIKEEELCSIDWHIRVRSDGPLAAYMHLDTWWNNGPSGNTVVNFHPDGQLNFAFYGTNPFQPMFGNAPEGNAGYTINWPGNTIDLSFNVREYVGRHPDNWGFVIMSNGSVWTGFPMPKMGDDVLLEDQAVSNIIKQKPIHGFDL